MKPKFIFQFIFIFFAIGFLANIKAEDIIFRPDSLVPGPNSYYLAGYLLDKNKDGVMELYDSCDQEFQEFHHVDSGEYNGFIFKRGLIMPTCTSKDLPSDVSVGYYQLCKGKNFGTDSAIFGFIQSPPIINLEKIYIETSPDITPKTDRHIYYMIEYSKDFGLTWEDDTIKNETLTKKGDYYEYLPGDLVFPAIDSMINASKTDTILIRVRSGNEQRIRIHKFTIVAQRVVLTSIKKIQNIIQKPSFKVINNYIISESGNLQVFNMLGQFIGYGESIYIPKSGIYIVKSANGLTNKVFIK
jgi:hypothetical protein